jgi:hypothetical protein
MGIEAGGGSAGGTEDEFTRGPIVLPAAAFSDLLVGGKTYEELRQDALDLITYYSKIDDTDQFPMD